MRACVLSVAILAGCASAAGAQPFYGAITGDARYAAFTSPDETLVAGDANGASDVFVRDLQAGVTTRVSVTSAGTERPGDSGDGVDIDESGNFVVFQSHARLDPADTNTCPIPDRTGPSESCPDIYIRDRSSGQTTLVSRPAGGGLANGPSSDPRISDDGAWITFTSEASNLVPGDTNGSADVFLVERATGAIRLLNRSAGGIASGWSTGARLSADGGL